MLGLAGKSQAHKLNHTENLIAFQLDCLGGHRHVMYASIILDLGIFASQSLT